MTAFLKRPRLLGATLPAAEEPPAAGKPVTLTELTGGAAVPQGLSSDEAARRLASGGANRLQTDNGAHPIAILIRQFRSPLVLILLAAAALSFALRETTEASLVVLIVLASGGLSFYQEYRAAGAVEMLRRRLAVSSIVMRDGREQQVTVAEVVPGDVVRLGAGSMVPADAVVFESKDLQLDEAALTGESFPVTKAAPALNDTVTDAARVFMGTTVRSGTAMALVVETGPRTRFGRIGASVARLEPETAFGSGIRRFGLLMTQVMLVLVTLVLTANVILGRPVLDSLLFAAALAVGMTPELLPAIVTVTLATGAQTLAKRGVLVRRLVAIENLGAMDVLCTDKTGTLTEGAVRLTQATDAGGAQSDAPLKWGALNAALQAGLPNPLDLAIIEAAGATPLGYRRLGELPYDFERRRISVLVDGPDGRQLICKGAVGALLPLCDRVAEKGGETPLTDARRQAELGRLADWSNQGLRVLAVAVRAMPDRDDCAAADEAELVLCGYLIFTDPLKPGIRETVSALGKRGVGLKIITGDNRFVAAHVAQSVGFRHARAAVGEDLIGLNERALAQRVAHADVFAEVTPDQKERIIAALRKGHHVVGFMGDGINDAPALRAADVGISVDTGVDAAKAAADVVLLERDLNVLLEGIVTGRTAFGNTLKYIRITISANLGNMVSMAAASLLLPFLPMLATQILLNNLLSDLPMLAISGDKMDPEPLARPLRWDFPGLLKAMVGFGLLSSLFDGLTFAVLLFGFQSSAALFQTGWFLESLLTELAVVAVLRTHRPFFMSAPSQTLIVISTAVAAVAMCLPYLPFAGAMGFTPLPIGLLAALLAIVIAYVAATEGMKRLIQRIAMPSLKHHH